MKKNISVLMIMILLAVSLISGCSQEEVYPSKAIELVVPWSAGGGSDRFARAIAEEINSQELLPEPIVVVNKEGGNGIVGATYTKQKEGDSYTIMTHVTSEIGAWLTAESSDVSIEDFTPIAMLAWDEYILMVKADSPFNTFDEILEYTKENPGEITIGGSGVGTVDQMLSQQMINFTGADIKYVPFEGGGEIMSAILGGHITANWANPGEAQSQIDAGTLKALVVASDKRLEALPDVPTTVEEGYDVTFRQYRGIVGTKDMPDEHVKIISDALKKVSESTDFREKYAKANSLTVDYRAKDEFVKVIDDTVALAKEILNK